MTQFLWLLDTSPDLLPQVATGVAIYTAGYDTLICIPVLPGYTVLVSNGLVQFEVFVSLLCCYRSGKNPALGLVLEFSLTLELSFHLNTSRVAGMPGGQE